MEKLNKTIGFFVMLAGMLIITFMPVITEASTNQQPYKSVETTKNSVSDTNTQTGTLTYFYNGATLMDAEDDNGNMSSYLGKAVRSIINESSKTVVQTNFLPYNGKNIVSENDETGLNVVDSYDYSPYGTPIYTDSSAKSADTDAALSLFINPLMYNGYYYDAESGLYYLNARYYSPELMRFISMDTYNLSNRYGYANGNPIWYSDPTGHFSLANLLINLVVTAVMIALLAVPAAGEVTDAGLAVVQAGVDADAAATTAEEAATATEEGVTAAEQTAANSRTALQDFSDTIDQKIVNGEEVSDNEIRQGSDLIQANKADSTYATATRNAANELRTNATNLRAEADQAITKAEKIAPRDQWQNIVNQGKTTWQSASKFKDGVSQLGKFSRLTQSWGGKFVRAGIMTTGFGINTAGNATNDDTLSYVGTGVSVVGSLGGAYAMGIYRTGLISSPVGGGIATDYFFKPSGEEDHGGGNYASNNSPANSTASNYINNLY